MSVEVIREKTVTARKAHGCETCNRPAALPGESYHRSTLVFDGRVYDWVQCQQCREMSSEVWTWTGYDDDGIGPDDYYEWAQEHATHGTPYQKDMARHYMERLSR